MIRLRIIVLLLVVLLLAMLLVALNPQYVPLDLGIWQGSLRSGLALGWVLVVGLLIGVMIRTTWITSLLRERGRLRRALKAAEARLVNTTRNGNG